MLDSAQWRLRHSPENRREIKLAPVSQPIHSSAVRAARQSPGDNINTIMNIRFRLILTVASLAFASWLPSQVRAEELKEATVTQVIRDVRLLPSNATPRPAVVRDNVRPGVAVKTGDQSRSELTFKDQTITRLGEKTIFSVGEAPRTIELRSGQFLLYVPKNSGGAKVKMGAVTAAITG